MKLLLINSIKNVFVNSLNITLPLNKNIKINYIMYVFVIIGIIILKKLYELTKK